VWQVLHTVYPQTPYTRFQSRQFAKRATDNFLVTSVTKIIWPWSWSDSIECSRLYQNCSFLVTSDSKYECFKGFLVSARRSIPQAILVTWLRSKLACFQTGLNMFLWWVYSRSWQAWQDFRTRTEIYMCSTKVSRVWSQWKIKYRFTQCGKRVHVFWQIPIGAFSDFIR